MRYAAVSILFLWACQAFAQGDPVMVDGVAAYVNGEAITIGDVRDMMAPAVAEMVESRRGKELEARVRELYEDALGELIAMRLILKAYETDAKINKPAVEKHVEARVSEFIQERYQGDRQEFLKALQGERLTMEEWRRRFRERIVVGLMRNREVDSRVVVSPREVRAVYEARREEYRQPERVKLRMILVRGGTNGTDRAVREGLAGSVAGKLQAGLDFGDCARQFSEDPSSSKGGEWGEFAVTDLRPELANAISRLETGKASGVIPVDGDFYLVRVEARKPAGVVPFEDVRGTIEKELRRKESNRLLKAWIAVLEKNAHIDKVNNGTL